MVTRIGSGHRRSWCAPTAYSILSPEPPELLALPAKPLTLKFDLAPGCQPPIFVRHALDSPWVESRVDGLAVAVSSLVGHFQLSITDPQLPGSGLYPSHNCLEQTTLRADPSMGMRPKSPSSVVSDFSCLTSNGGIEPYQKTCPDGDIFTMPYQNPTQIYVL